MSKIIVKERAITIAKLNETDYISLTDIAKFKTTDSFIVICNWMRNRNTIEYLGIWETLYNPDFKPIEFDRFKTEAGLNAFTMSPQEGLEQKERLIKLNKIAIQQMSILQEVENRKVLK